MPTKWALRVSGRTDLLGRIATSRSPLTALLRGRARSLLRSALRTAHVDGSAPSDAARETGNESANEVSTERFSTWFARNGRSSASSLCRGPTVTMFPGCVVEYETPGVGKETRRGVRARRHRVLRQRLPVVAAPRGCTQATSIGSPRSPRRNVEVFAAEIRGQDRAVDGAIDAARDVVVVEPTCRRVIVEAIPITCPAADASLVASHTFDATDHLAVRRAWRDEAERLGRCRRCTGLSAVRAIRVFPSFLWLSGDSRSTFVFSIGPVRRADGTTAGRLGESVNCVSAGNEVVGSRGVSGT